MGVVIKRFVTILTLVATVEVVVEGVSVVTFIIWLFVTQLGDHLLFCINGNGVGATVENVTR